MNNRKFAIARSKLGDILILDVFSENAKGDWPVEKLASGLFQLAEESECQKILIDMKGIKMVTSDVIGQLVMLIKKCQTAKLPLKLCGVFAENKLALDLVRLDQLVELYERKNQAIVEFKSGIHQLAAVGGDNGSAKNFIEPAKTGDPEAQYQLAKCLESGRGVKQDFGRAVDWFEKAAEQDHANSRYSLGVAYAYGIGTQQDFERAVDWFRLAAEQGHAESQFWIGLTVHHGLIGEPNPKNAMRWYKEAADQGHSDAHDAIAELRRLSN